MAARLADGSDPVVRMIMDPPDTPADGYDRTTKPFRWTYDESPSKPHDPDSAALRGLPRIDIPRCGRAA